MEHRSYIRRLSKIARAVYKELGLRGTPQIRWQTRELKESFGYAVPERNLFYINPVGSDGPYEYEFLLTILAHELAHKQVIGHGKRFRAAMRRMARLVRLYEKTL